VPSRLIHLFAGFPRDGIVWGTIKKTTLITMILEQVGVVKIGKNGKGEGIGINSRQISSDHYTGLH